MKQRLGEKKHKICEIIGGKTYINCWTSGNFPHYVAECWYTTHDADYVNYRSGWSCPTIRNGIRMAKLPGK